MAAEKVREAYRAIYLASPLRYGTTLHAFNRVVPRLHIEPWKKDPHAALQHKWRRVKARKQGAFAYRHGPLSGVNAEGWPEPGLLGAAALVQVAVRAQEERLQNFEFWEQLAERTFKLRDIISAGDLATVLDALLTADHRHTLLMKTLAREFIDDADKLSLAEVAAVANAYMQFNCHSEDMLQALARQATDLLTGRGNSPSPPGGGDLDSDPACLAVLTKAFVAFKLNNTELFQAVNASTAERVGDIPFAALSQVLASFAETGHAFEADASFWEAVATKVPEARMASLCPLLLAVGRLRLEEPSLREALVKEVLAKLQETPAGELPAPLRARLEEGLPALAQIPAPARMLDLALPLEEGEAAEAAEAEPEEVAVEEFDPLLTRSLGGLEGLEEVEASDALAEARKERWYNAVSRCMPSPAFPTYVGFDASQAFARNRRGVLVAEALEGVGLLWGRRPDAAAALPEDEAKLVEVAGPVLRSSLQGLSSAQLAAAAEVFALHAKQPGPGQDESEAALRDVIQESVRKLSNFKHSDLLRLWDAAAQAGVADPYLERARKRRFPKALRNELRDRK